MNLEKSEEKIEKKQRKIKKLRGTKKENRIKKNPPKKEPKKESGQTVDRVHAINLSARRVYVDNSLAIEGLGIC